MKNVLVTGGAGYIGSHTVVELLEAGFTPIILDNFANSHKDVITKIEKIASHTVRNYVGDFQDLDLLEQINNQIQIEGIIHFAAFKAVEESISQPLRYYQNNVSGFVALLGFMKKNHIPNIIFSSSANVYGDSDELPIVEDTPVKTATSPYGATKQMGEIILKDTTHTGGIKATALRYFNPIGAHPSALIGELPISMPTNLVPVVMQSIINKIPLTIFGDDYSTRDGTCIRDFVHVQDLAKAHVSALRHLFAQQEGFYDVFNVGTGSGTTLLELIETFQDANGVKVPYKIGPRRNGDIVTSYASVAKANKVLNWKAEKTLSNSLQDAWRWQKNLTS